MRISDWSSDVCSSDLGIQAECIKLNGAMEIAPTLGLASHIVDLVSTGRTLTEHALEEQKIISEVSSRLIVNHAAFKLISADVPALVARVREIVGHTRTSTALNSINSCATRKPSYACK